MQQRLPRRLQKWWDISRVAESRQGVDHILILAVLDRETGGGEFNRPKGAGGTGDWTPRHWSRYHARPDAEKRFKHWRPSRDDFERIFKRTLPTDQLVPELCSPIDGLGFGRGLMQIDYADPDNEAFLAELMEDGSPAWKDAARNIDFGANKLAARIALFGGDEFLGTAGYNAKPERIQQALLALSGPATNDRRYAAADKCTTGGNYASDVMGRRRHFQSLMLSEEET